MNRKLLALAAVVGLLGAVVGPGVAAAASSDAGNESTAETAGNAPDDGAFGLAVSQFVHSVQDDANDTAIGLQVATFVTANNPGNAPAFAGPPAHAGPGAADAANETANATDGGPAAHVGDNETNAASGNETRDDGDRGPPEHAGGSDDAESGDGDGPPAHAGPDR